MPNDVNTRRYVASFVDRDNEKSSTSVRVESFDDNTLYETARLNFETAVDALTNGTRYKRVESLDVLVGSSSPPENNSFREDKWLVRVEDVVTYERYSFTIPTADASAAIFIPGEDKIDLTQTTGLALKDAIESFVVSPDDNDISVVSVEYVGRNI